MKTRVELSSILRELLESDHVYYQPPEGIKMEYPAIRYNRSTRDSRYANDGKYIKRQRWELVVISKTVDHPVIEKLLELDYCSHDRRYVADNLYHDVLTLYY